jgi:hemerythrin superfamily protein
MAKAKRRATTRGRARQVARGRQTAGQQDAISLLKADHEQVREWFEQFESARSADRKEKLAQQICQALEIHTQIEEQVFYPAFLEVTGEDDIHHEAEVEHNGAKRLIAEIEASGPEDEYFDARVTVLREMIRHHVNEEEKRDGMFAKARKADMDLMGLGEQLATRKAELMSDSGMTEGRRSSSSRPVHSEPRA